MSERKLQAWLSAGVIDASTAGRIRAWEAEHSRPLALWAVIGIGALAIGLGVISVVAANWEDVPGMVRLAIHFAVMLALGQSLIGAPLARSLRLPESVAREIAEKFIVEDLVGRHSEPSEV